MFSGISSGFSIRNILQEFLPQELAQFPLSSRDNCLQEGQFVLDFASATLTQRHEMEFGPPNVWKCCQRHHITSERKQKTPQVSQDLPLGMHKFPSYSSPAWGENWELPH